MFGNTICEPRFLWEFCFWGCFSSTFVLGFCQGWQNKQKTISKMQQNTKNVNHDPNTHRVCCVFYDTTTIQNQIRFETPKLRNTFLHVTFCVVLQHLTPLFSAIAVFCWRHCKIVFGQTALLFCTDSERPFCTDSKKHYWKRVFQCPQDQTNGQNSYVSPTCPILTPWSKHN